MLTKLPSPILTGRAWSRPALPPLLTWSHEPLRSLKSRLRTLDVMHSMICNCLRIDKGMAADMDLSAGIYALTPPTIKPPLFQHPQALHCESFKTGALQRQCFWRCLLPLARVLRHVSFHVDRAGHDVICEYKDRNLHPPHPIIW